MHAPGLHDQVGLSVHFRDLFVFDKTKGLKKKLDIKYHGFIAKTAWYFLVTLLEPNSYNSRVGSNTVSFQG